MRQERRQRSIGLEVRAADVPVVLQISGDRIRDAASVERVGSLVPQCSEHTGQVGLAERITRGIRCSVLPEKGGSGAIRLTESVRDRGQTVRFATCECHAILRQSDRGGNDIRPRHRATLPKHGVEGRHCPGHSDDRISVFCLLRGVRIVVGRNGRRPVEAERRSVCEVDESLGSPPQTGLCGLGDGEGQSRGYGGIDGVSAGLEDGHPCGGRCG